MSLSICFLPHCQDFPVSAQLVELVHLLVSAYPESLYQLSPLGLCSVLPLKEQALQLGNSVTTSLLTS